MNWLRNLLENKLYPSDDKIRLTILKNAHAKMYTVLDLRKICIQLDKEGDFTRKSKRELLDFLTSEKIFESPTNRKLIFEYFGINLPTSRNFVERFLHFKYRYWLLFTLLAAIWSVSQLSYSYVKGRQVAKKEDIIALKQHNDSTNAFLKKSIIDITQNDILNLHPSPEEFGVLTNLNRNDLSNINTESDAAKLSRGLMRSLYFTILGNRLFYEEQYSEAIKNYDKAIKIYAQNFTAWNNMGLTYIKINLPINAKYCFEQAGKINNGVASLFLWKAIALDELHDYDSSAINLNYARSLDSSIVHDPNFNKFAFNIYSNLGARTRDKNLAKKYASISNQYLYNGFEDSNADPFLTSEMLRALSVNFSTLEKKDSVLFYLGKAIQVCPINAEALNSYANEKYGHSTFQNNSLCDSQLYWRFRAYSADTTNTDAISSIHAEYAQDLHDYKKAAIFSAKLFKLKGKESPLIVYSVVSDYYNDGDYNNLLSWTDTLNKYKQLIIQRQTRNKNNTDVEKSVLTQIAKFKGYSYYKLGDLSKAKLCFKQVFDLGYEGKYDSYESYFKKMTPNPNAKYD